MNSLLVVRHFEDTEMMELKALGRAHPAVCEESLTQDEEGVSGRKSRVTWGRGR